MTGATFIAAAITVGLNSSPAASDTHDGMVMSGADESSFGAGASIIAAKYGPTTFFVGNYQGVTPEASWTRDWFSASAMIGIYRLDEDGRVVYGVGDLMAVANATALDRENWRGGVTLATMLPTGDEGSGLGMGHVMVMPALWLSRPVWRIVLRGSVGYDRALASLTGHVHGLWPLVEPMNLQQVSWRASASVPAVWRKLDLAASASGGIPFGVAMGVDYAAGALRASWVDSRMTTSIELQFGIVGDPYIVRGLVETMVRL